MFGAVFCGVWCFVECELLSVELLKVELFSVECGVFVGVRSGLFAVRVRGVKGSVGWTVFVWSVCLGCFVCLVCGVGC